MAELIRSQEPLYAEGIAVTPDELRESCRENLALRLRSTGRRAEHRHRSAPCHRQPARRSRSAPFRAAPRIPRGRTAGLGVACRARRRTRSRHSAALRSRHLGRVRRPGRRGHRGLPRDQRRPRPPRPATSVRPAQRPARRPTRRRHRPMGIGGRAQLPQHGTFVVVAAECPTPGEEALPGIEDVLRRHDVVSAWRLDAQQQEGLVVLRPRFDIARLCTELAEPRTRPGRRQRAVRQPRAHRAGAPASSTRLRRGNPAHHRPGALRPGTRRRPARQRPRRRGIDRPPHPRPGTRPA